MKAAIAAAVAFAVACGAGTYAYLDARPGNALRGTAQDAAAAHAAPLRKAS